MKKLLDFEKPKKVKSSEDHNKIYMSDSGVAGTYVPNMSDEDKNKWKAKHIKGDDERIEIRKSLNGVQILIVIYKNPFQPNKPVFPEYDGGGKDFYWEQANIFYRADCKRYAKRHQNVQMSMNGKIDMTWDNWWDLTEAVKEALEILL
jgi:hypothetical protein